jgi:hypothetical protein
LKSLWILAICPLVLAAQHPDFNGVWRLRGSGTSLLWISQKGGDLDLKMFSQYGKRYGQAEAIFTIGSERTGVYARMPAKFTANWDGDGLILEWAATWPWGEQSERHRFTLNASELIDDSSDTFGTRVRQHHVVYDRDPPESLKFFSYPEQTAGDHYKNIQILKAIPETELTPLMATFQTALGVKCEYCHNQSAYDSDQLPAKAIARKMLSMVADLNQREFAGRPAVTCATCHRGKSTPDR